MLDVKVENFDQVTKIIENLLKDKNATFVSIDLELSGVHHGNSHMKISRYDLPCERYV